MVTANRLPVDKDLIPYSFDIELTGSLFTFTFEYNHLHDFFTVTLSKGGEVSVYNEPVAYGTPLFKGVWINDGSFPACDIVPLDLSGGVSVVNWETFCRDVFLYIDSAEEALIG